LRNTSVTENTLHDKLNYCERMLSQTIQFKTSGFIRRM